MTGIKTQHWSSGYAPSKVVIYISEDGNKWKSMGDIRTSGSTQNISLKVPMDTRFLKYDMLSYPKRVDVTEFNIYIAK